MRPSYLLFCTLLAATLCSTETEQEEPPFSKKNTVRLVTEPHKAEEVKTEEATPPETPSLPSTSPPKKVKAQYCNSRPLPDVARAERCARGGDWRVRTRRLGVAWLSGLTRGFPVDEHDARRAT